jgi:hypothetical protein
MPATNPSPTVTIIGGGIAGLTAALRLAERGFAVTIYERGPLLGGNLSGVRRMGVYHDIYPHMFAQWFHNFWKLTEDIGLTKGRDFERRSECAFLRSNDFPHYRVGVDIGAFRTGLKNLSSGILSLPEMFLVNYTVLDALVCGDMDGDFLQNQTLNDFIVNRPYATPAVTQFFNATVNNIWSINSYLSSARAYQRFAKYQFREPSPLCWVLKGSSYQSFIEPLRKRLEELHCTLMEHTEVTGVTVREGKVTDISFEGIVYDADGLELNKTAPQTDTIDNLIIASSPASLGELVFSKAKTGSSARSGARSIVSLLPRLANVRRLGSEPLPVLYGSFRRALPNIPPYYVALLDSKYSLTFVQIERLSGPQKTVMAIAASDFDSIPIKFAIKTARARGQTKNRLVVRSVEAPRAKRRRPSHPERICALRSDQHGQRCRLGKHFLPAESGPAALHQSGC